MENVMISKYRWMDEARRSPVDHNGRVGCRVCGLHFSAYNSLAQHLGSLHGGHNSDDAKFALLVARANPSTVKAAPPVPEDFPALTRFNNASSMQSPYVNDSDSITHGDRPIPGVSTGPTLADAVEAAISSGRNTGSMGLVMVRQAKAKTPPSVIKSCRTINTFVPPAGLRLRRGRKKRLSVVKQQVLRIRMDRSLKAAQDSHNGASVAFNKLIGECEALLCQLREVAADIGIEKNAIDLLIVGQVPSDDVSKSPTPQLIDDGSEPLSHFTSDSPPLQRFQILQRAVQLSRVKVEAAAAVLDERQLNLLKVSSEHSRTMLRLSLSVDRNKALSEGSCHVDDVEDNIEGDEEASIFEDSILQPGQSDLQQTMDPRSLEVSKSCTPMDPASETVSEPTRVVPNPSQPHLISNICSISPGNSSDDDDDDDDDEGGSLPRGWTDVLSGWAGKLPARNGSGVAQEAPFNPCKDPQHTDYGNWSSFRQQGIHALQMVVDKAVGSTPTALVTSLDPVEPDPPRSLIQASAPVKINLQQQETNTSSLLRPSESAAANRPISWPLVQPLGLPGRPRHNPASDSPSFLQKDDSLGVRPRSGLTLLSRLGGSGTEVLGEALQRLQELQLEQQTVTQQLHQEAAVKQPDQHDVLKSGQVSRPSVLSSAIGSLVQSNFASGSPAANSGDIMYGSRLSSWTDVSLTQPKSGTPRPYSDGSSAANGGLENDINITRSRPTSNTSLMDRPGSGAFNLHDVSPPTSAQVQQAILPPQTFPSIDNSMLIHQQSAVDWQQLPDNSGSQTQWMSMQSGNPHTDVRLLNQVFPQQVIPNYTQEIALQQLHLSWQQQQQAAGMHQVDLAANQAAALLNAMAAAQNLSPPAGSSLIQGHQPWSQGLQSQQQQTMCPPWVSTHPYRQPLSAMGPSTILQGRPRPGNNPMGGYALQPPMVMFQPRSSFPPFSSGQSEMSPSQQILYNQTAPPPPPRVPLRGPSSGPSVVETEVQYACEICKIQCNSAVNLEQHIQSRKHLARAARIAAAGVEAAARELQIASGMGNSLGTSLAGPITTVHNLCKQIISPDLNSVVSDLLLRMKSFQDRAIAKNAIKAASRKWYVCGLREVRKAVKLQKAVSVVIAPNIEQMDVTGGLDDHLQDILNSCGDQEIPVVFALTRKRLGQVYGCRKRVSAVALLDVHGVEDLHARMVQLMSQGRMEWDERVAAGGQPPVLLIEEAEDDDAYEECA